MKTLTFQVDIHAPRALVWRQMLEPAGYQAWTAAFCEGSHYVGTWDEGAKIQFLAPQGDGMVAEIAENQPQQFVSIRHLGVVDKGVQDTTSDKVRAWAPAYETYRFADLPDGCRVVVTLDCFGDFESFMQDTFPKALALLKAQCEAAAGQLKELT